MEGKKASFEPTRWSLVAMASETEGRNAEHALNEICQLYWYPLYAYLRRTGKPAEESEDLTQEFLAWFVANRQFERADSNRGKLRSFLLGCLKNFVSNQYRKDQAQKRGGSAVHVSIDQEWAEGRLKLDPADESGDPDLLFDRNWARSVLEMAMGRLRKFFESKGQLERYEVLKSFLTAESGAMTFHEAGEKLGITEGAAKGIVHRMRERFKEMLTLEVRETLMNTGIDDVDAELGYLLQVLSKP